MIDADHHDAHRQAGWHVLSQMLQWPQEIPDISMLVAERDFYMPTQATLFAELIRNPTASSSELSRASGAKVEDIEENRSGLTRPTRRRTTEEFPLALRKFAVDYRTVLELSRLQDIVGSHNSELVVPEMLQGILDDYAGTEPVGKLTTFTDVIAREVPEREWIFDGLLAKGWTMILVGGEGAGKSTLLRQFAFCAAAGLTHPFSFADRYHDREVRALVIDIENMEEELDREWADLANREWPRSKRASNNVTRVLENETLFIQRPPFGLDITTPAGFGTLHAYCRQAQPDLLCIGPLYFLQPKAKGRDAEEVAIEVVSQLQRIRDEFRCAIVMETHAPKGSGGNRDMVSFGSSVYLRWPGIQLGLVPDPDTPGAYLLEKNRGHRYSDAEWPERLWRADKGTDHRYWSLSSGGGHR